MKRSIIHVVPQILLIVIFSALSWADPLGIQVRDTSGLNVMRPVTGGVPLAQGAAPNGFKFTLRNENNEIVPCQTSVLAHWKDGSARWVLLDFQANPPAGGASQYSLSWGESGASKKPEFPVIVENLNHPVIRSGEVSISTAENALLRISDRLDVKLTLRDKDGHRCNGTMESVSIQAKGDSRSTLILSGSFRKEDGTRIFGFRIRASVYAGLSKVNLEPIVIVDSGEDIIQTIQELNLEFVPINTMQAVTIGGAPGWKGRPISEIRLFQVDDRTYQFEESNGSGTKAPGWAEIKDNRGSIALALKDFWQQWPKSIETNSTSVSFGLFPRFHNGAFDHMEPWYKYDYLFQDNCYRLRTGQARRWQVWIDLSGDGSSLATFANAPLVPSADPEQAIATGAWGSIAAAGTKGMEEYDRWAENLFDNGYCQSIVVQRDYGAMNWGDWFGERQCNWGNHEYDTPKHILAQFARTGDPKYFYVGDIAARHTSEVDTVHFVNDDLRAYFQEKPDYPARPGMVHQHMVGHVGGFHSMEAMKKLYVSFGTGKSDNPYICWSPFNLGHIWTQGMVYHYFLTGDPWMKETVKKIGDNLVQLVEDRRFKFKGHSHCGRVNGWTMLAIAGAYELDRGNDRYLHAMKLLADDALSEQDPHCGGWLYTLPWGHCFCETKHVGEAGFIGSVRINGLCKYYELSGDERIPEAVKRGVTHLNNDTWVEKFSGWRYTSCPASSSGPGRQTGVTVMALVNSVKLTGDPEQLRILKKAWNAKFAHLKVAPTSRPGLGKTYSTIMYGCPEAMNLFVNGLE